MLRHESHVFELQVETKFDVCDPCSFLMLLSNLCTTVESLGKKKTTRRRCFKLISFLSAPT